MTLPLSLCAHRAFPQVTYAQLRAELQREAEARRRTYPQLVAKGRMTEAEAAHQHAILAAIAQDLEAVIALTPAHPEPVEGPSFSWFDKRACLQRELAQRARFYPGWIAKGNMTAPAGAHQVDCLKAMLAIYGEGWGWRAANGFPPAWGEESPTPEQAEARAEWAEISAALAAQNEQQQETLAL